MWQDVVSTRLVRCGHASAAVGPLVFTFGGYSLVVDAHLSSENTSLPPMEVFVYDTRSGESVELPTPAEGSEQYREVPRRRLGHSAVVFEDSIFVWGGQIV
ncbi:uncharacterized protein GBIM_18180, partial [Gryllus bimaculatus]